MAPPGHSQPFATDAPADVFPPGATPALAIEAMRAEVAPALWPQRDVTGVVSKGTYTKKGKWRSFTFEVSFATEAPQTVVLTFGADSDMQRVYRRYYDKAADVKKQRPKGQATYVEGTDCLAEVFPSDWKLPTLTDALDESRVLPLLLQAAGWPHDDDARVEAHAFRFKPHRRTLVRYSLGEATIRREFIGKLFTDEERAQQGWDVLRQLYERPETHDLVPRPAAFEPGLFLLVMDRMPGVMLSDLLTGPSADAGRLIELAAALLARLHSVRIEAANEDGPRNLESELRKIESRFDTLPAVSGELVPTLRWMVETLRLRSYEALDEGGYSFLHGDFNPRQILVDGDDFRVVDLDGGCLGDPAVDVGRFMASLRSNAVEQGSRDTGWAAEHFLQAYETSSGRRLRERATAVMVLRMVYRCERLLLMPSPENLATVQALTQDAQRVVTGVAVDSVSVRAARRDTHEKRRRSFDAWLLGGFWRIPARLTAAAAHVFAVIVGLD